MQNNCKKVNIFSMKKIVFLMLITLSSITYAQRTDGGISIQAKFGLLETLQGKKEGKGELIKDMSSFGSLGVQYLIGQAGAFLEANALMKDFSIYYEEIDKPIPYRLYGLNVMGGWSYEDLNPFYINLKIGGFGGYAIINKGENKDGIYNTTFDNSVKGLSYGAVGSVEGEIVIWKKLTGVIAYEQYFYPKDKWIRWQYGINAGLKYYF